MVSDKLNRNLHDLRISVTDRCNFRCSYCMPKDVFHPNYEYLQRSEVLSHEEILRIAKISYELGVRKFRLTGGEPLIRKNIEFLIEGLANIDPDVDISLTTNGALLTKAKAQDLKNAGLKRVTISLDALDDNLFKSMNDMGIPSKKVLRGIDHAMNYQLGPVKVNMVVMKGINDGEIIPMSRYFLDKAVILRFIEFMDVGNSNNWQYQNVLTSKNILDILKSEFDVSPVDANYHGEVANRWHIVDKQNNQLNNEIGIISSITQPFCKSCHRLRLSAEGKLYTCLFANQGFDIKSLIRSDADNEAIKLQLTSLWQQREDRYSELRQKLKVAPPKVEMSYIGG